MISKKILLYVADQKNREGLAKLLKKNGYIVELSVLPENVIDEITGINPDLLIIDGNLLQTYGTQIITRFPGKSILGWMNERNSELAVELISNGAKDCIYAPINTIDVLGVVYSALGLDSSHIVKLKKFRLFRSLIPAFISISVLVFFYFSKAFKENAQLPQTFALSYQNPTGVSKEDTYLWTCDWYTQNIYKYTVGKNMELVKSTHYADFSPATISVSKNYLYVAGNDGILRKMEIVQNDLLFRESFRLPSRSVSAICVQKDFIWAVDSENSKIFQLELKNPDNLIAAFNYTGHNPSGFAWDGEYFWSIEGKTNKIHRHKGPKSLFEIISTFSFPQQNLGVAQGLSSDGKNLWIIFSGSGAKLLKYPISELL